MSAITKRYPGVVANDGIDITLDRGEIVGLLGENGAGKSTLVNILAGLTQPDSGAIAIDGERVQIRSPRDAADHGIGMVHQHFKLVGTLTVAENVALGRGTLRSQGGMAAVHRRIRELSAELGLEVDPAARVEDLSVGRKQRVEILKLLYGGARILVFDEPTAVLTPVEWKELAGVLRGLADAGRGILFISHKLDEHLDVSHRCVVLRDGAVVGSTPTADATARDLATMMVGREVVLRAHRTPQPAGDVVLQVQDLAATDPDGHAVLDGLSFDLRAGEILGVAGVDGNGQRELEEALLGLLPRTTGTISVDGEVLEPSARNWRRAGGAVIPGDRHRTGVALDLTLRENLMITELGRRPASRRGVLRRGYAKRHAASVLAAFDVRAPNAEVRMGQLSGGNQQKVVLARELWDEPRILVAAQPTRGLDVGAMEAVYGRILDHRARGGATLLISAELEEVLTLSDRVAVLFRGRLVAVLDNQDLDVDRLGLLMVGQASAPAAAA